MWSPGAVVAARYEILHPLGEGGQGQVFKALDRHQGHVVAVKFLDGHYRGVWDEARVLTGLRGDFVLPVHNADIASGVPYLVTEVAQHGTLASEIPDTGLRPDAAVRYVRHACRGTTRAHDAGLLHCDIKPENIFLDENGNARLGDFGLAALMDANAEAPAAGSPSTIAPEVASGSRCTVSSDVYSLGATLYIALSGRPPVPPPENGDVYDWLDSVATQDPQRLIEVAPGVSAWLSRCVERAMRRDPTERFQSPAEFDAALGQQPTPTRRWWRTDEHPEHRGCWRGDRPGRSCVLTCAVPQPGPRGERFAVETRRVETGHLVKRACRPAAPPSQLSRHIRSAMTAVDQ